MPAPLCGGWRRLTVAFVFAAPVALAAAAATAPVAIVHAAPAPAASTDGQCVQLPNDGSRCPAWGHTWLNPGGNNSACATDNVPLNQVAGATGVYVTGWACDAQDKYDPSTASWIPGDDAFTVAYNLDGTVRWVARYNGPGGANDALGDFGYGIALSPDGSVVYVTGGQNGGLGGTQAAPRFVSDFVTNAYDTTTGVQLWSTGYHGPAVGPDIAEQVAVSGDGQRVYVTGESQAADLAGGTSGGSDATTISYAAATGVQDWVTRYHAPASERNNAIATNSIAVHGSVVYTAGTYETSSGSGYEVLAIQDDRAMHTGALLWSSLSDPTLFIHPARGALAATAGGVYLAGTEATSDAPPPTCPPQQTSGASSSEYVTVGLAPLTGAVNWTSIYSGDTGGDTGAFGLAADATGDRVFVAGQASGPAPQCAISIATVAYDGATGAQLWSDVQPPLTGTAPQGFAIAAAPDGGYVYVAGLEYYTDTLGYRGDSRVLAYDSDGTLLWSGRYNSGPVGLVTDLDSFGYYLSLSPDGSMLYLTDQVNRHDPVNGNSQLYGTVAYAAVAPSTGLAEAPWTGALLLAGSVAGVLYVRRRCELRKEAGISLQGDQEGSRGVDCAPSGALLDPTAT